MNNWDQAYSAYRRQKRVLRGAQWFWACVIGGMLFGAIYTGAAL